jgi:hypothetical protein
MSDFILRRYFWRWRIGRSTWLSTLDLEKPSDHQEDAWVHDFLARGFRTKEGVIAAFSEAVVSDGYMGFEAQLANRDVISIGDPDSYRVETRVSKEHQRLIKKLFDTQIGPGIAGLAFRACMECIGEDEDEEAEVHDLDWSTEDDKFSKALHDYLSRAWSQFEIEVIEQAIRHGKPVEAKLTLT